MTSDTEEQEMLTAARAALGSEHSLTLKRVAGHASGRVYHRAMQVPQSAMVMRRPESNAPTEASDGDSDQDPFLAMQSFLSERGVRVPKLLSVSDDKRTLVLEDLGDTTLYSKLTAECPRADWWSEYERAIKALAQMHDKCSEGPSLAHERSFDARLLRWEVEHFIAWGLEALTGPLTDAERKLVDEAFEALIIRLTDMPTGFVHRDFQSQNLLCVGDAELAVIDFQDALIGPRTYDLAALLCDSYVNIPVDLQRAMIKGYAVTRSLDPKAIEREFWCVALHRKLKDAGRFIFIDRVRGNPDYLKWYAPTFHYIGRALARTPGMGGIAEMLRRRIPGFPYNVAPPARATGEAEDDGR